MNIRELFKELLRTFVIVTTCVNVATYILGSIYSPEQQFGYEAFLSPLIYGFFSLFPCLIMYSRKEMSVKGFVIRKVIQLVLLEIIMYYVAFGSGRQEAEVVIAFEISVAIIYFVAHWISWLINKRDAEILSKQLVDFQQKINNKN